MKLCSVALENFRQFYGKQHIDFSYDAQNITVILGENGDGKTGIFRAVMFCLFNEKELPKDRANRGANPNKVHLVNLNALQENMGIPMEARVTLTFINGGEKYFLERSIYDMMTESGEVRRNLEVKVKLSIQDENGNIGNILTKDGDVEKRINKIINNRIKDLFFFDGDKIEDLSTTNSSSREEIKNGIMKLLRIDSINRAIEIISRLKSDQHRIIKSKADTKLQIKEEQLEELQQELVYDRESLDNKRSELERVRTTIAGFEYEQQENASIRELFKQRANILEDRKKTEKIIDDIRIAINGMMSKYGHNLLLHETIRHTLSFIEKEERSNSYNSGITADLIEEIIESRKCICERTFEVGDETYFKMQELKRRYEKMKLSGFVRDFKRNLRLLLSFDEHDIDIDMQKQLKDYFTYLDELEELRKRLDEIDREKNEYSQKEDRLKGIEISLQRCKQNAKSFSEAIVVLEYEIASKEQRITAQEQEIKELRKKDMELRRDNNILEYYERLFGLFISIRDTYSSRMRAYLSKESTEIFEQLISEKDKRILNQIIINEYYEIQAKGWNDISIFQDISSGQKQMLSLSFVAALARVAAGGNTKTIDIPLFMDTPFAKLDGNNRANLIMSMPKLASQWILLVTDTEFARNEVIQMRATQQWGKFYRLNKLRNGHTQIVPISDINSFAVNR